MKANEENNKFAGARKTFENFCGLLLFLAVTISMLEIVTRIFFRVSFDLLFDFPVWITVWAVLLITGFLLPEGGHISIDFVKNKFSGKLRWLIEVLLGLTTLAWGTLITWGSIRFLQQLYTRKSVFPRYFAIPMWVVELCVPIGMFIFSVYAAIGLVKAMRNRW